MKIFYLSHARIPSRTANSLNVMKMCEAFAQNGHDVTLFAPRSSRTEPGVEDSFAFYGVEPRFDLKRFPKKGKGLRGIYSYFSIVSWWIRLRRPDLLYGRDHSLRYDLDQFGIPVRLNASTHARRHSTASTICSYWSATTSRTAAAKTSSRRPLQKSHRASPRA